MNYRSLKFRLNLWYLFVFVLAILIAEAWIYIYLDRSLHNELDALLSEEAKELAKKIKFENGVPSFVDSTEFYEAEHFYLNEASVFFRVFDKNLNIVSESENLKTGRIAIPQPDKSKLGKADEIEINGKRLRIFYLPLYLDGEFYGVVETSKFEGTVQTAMGFLRNSLAIAIILTFVLVAYGGNLIVSKLISPLEQIVEKADKITGENLTERIDIGKDNYPVEVVKLVNSINKLLERIEKAFKQISQFTSDVAHELLTPLTVIKDEIEITLMKKRRSSEYVRTLNLIQKQTERTISIIKSMLYLAKAEAGIIKANLERVNLSDLIYELISTFSLKAKQKNIKVRFYCDGDVFVYTDEKLLFEALRNIIDNAIEYTNSGGRVEILCEKANGEVKIFVSDTGIGISEEDLQHIFNRFYRSRNAFEINPSG
ncbi:MAG: sensor histidine kinase [Candidatus Kryptonium sp.]